MRAVAPRRRWLVYLAAAGPGLIAASAGNDAGGIVTYSSAGAQFVYRTLFLMVLITVAYVIVQEMVARLAVHTGKGLAALIREQFSLRLTAFAITAFAIANVGLMVTEFGGIATSFELWGVSRYITVPVAAVAIWALVLFGSYRYAERVFLLLTLVFIAYPIAAVLGHPDWKAVAANTVWPHFVASKSFLLLSVALIGTTITPYIQLYEAGAVVDRGVKPEQYGLQRADAVVGAVVSNVVAMAIIVATGATIGGTGVLTSAATAAEGLKPVAGAAAETLFGLGLLGGVRAGRRGGAAVDVLRGGRGDRRGAFRLLELPPGAGLPRDLHLPDPGRGGCRPRAGQPHHAHLEHAGARGRHHPDDADPDPDPGQPALAARLGRQRPRRPLGRWSLHRGRGRGRLRLRALDRLGLVRPLVSAS